jgi:predicted tellurium resistance membrane protein TerC
MAVVFISPKQRQKVFFMGITIAFLLFLIIISLTVFLSGPKDVSPVLVFNKPKVNIDMSVFDSEQFKNLQPFDQMQIQYAYKATTKDKKQVSDFVSADSEEHAKTILEGMGLTVTDLKPVEIGRDNPFTPYYTVKPAAGTKITTKTK